MRQDHVSRVNLNKDKIHPIRVIIILTLMLLVIISALVIRGVSLHSPSVDREQLMSHQGHYSTLYADNGQVIWGQNHNRELNATIPEINYKLKPALLSIEDRNFENEHGINIGRTLFAVAHDFLHHNESQGGSTLTEQLVKNSFFPASTTAKKSIKEKIKEILIAQKVNRKFSKNRILQMYVDKVYMGSGIYGMKTASYFYFNRPLNKITTTQAALLAGMVQSPTSYDPYVHPEYAYERRNTVLHAMASNHKLSTKRANRLCKIPINNDVVPFSVKQAKAKKLQHIARISDDYTQGVLGQLDRAHYNLNRNSYRVKTALNLDLQQKIYDLVNKKSNIPWPSKHLNTAVTVINNRTGQAVAQIGGRGPRPLGAYDQAIEGNRSTGSSIKPILDYAPALDDLGWDTGKTIYDDRYKYPGTNHSLYDWDNQYQGKLTMARALINSRNIPAVKTLASVGLSRANKLARLAGIGSQKYYANAIGTDTSVCHLASAYSALANYGVRKQLSFIDGIGKSGTIKPLSSKAIQVMSPQTAYMLTKVLEDVPTKHGLGNDAMINGIAQAGKTGTVGYANGNKGMSKNAISDAWYVGYTKGYTIAIWTGYNNPKHEMTQSEANVSETLYRDIMKYLDEHDKNNTSEWKALKDIRTFRKGGLKQYRVKGRLVSPSLRHK